MPGLLDKIHAKLELLRLEKRYIKTRHRRSTFVSNAVYVDGEYIYQPDARDALATPSPVSRNSSVSSASTGASSTGASSTGSPAPAASPGTSPAPSPSLPGKTRKRFSILTAFPSPAYEGSMSPPALDTSPTSSATAYWRDY